MNNGNEMDRDMADRAIEKALNLGAEYAEARMEAATANSLILKNNNPEISGFDRSSGMSVRVLVKGSLGFASTDQLGGESVEDCFETAVRMAKAATNLTKERIFLSEESAHVKDYTVNQKKRISDVGADDMLDVMRHVDESMMAAAPLVSRYLAVYAEERTKYFVSSDGSKIGSHIPRVSMFMIPTIMEEGKVAQAMIQKGVAMGWEFMDPVRLSE